MNTPLSPETRHEVVVQAVLATPSAAAVLWTKILNLNTNDWLGLSGIGFIALQAAYLLWRWRRDIRRDRLEDGP